MIDLPWQLSQVSEQTRAKRSRRQLASGRLTDYLDQPFPYCGVLMDDRDGRESWRAPSRDNRIPRSRGGQNVVENIEIVCRRCNSNKGT